MQHSDLQDGSWNSLTLLEQLANIGSEVFRALKWSNKNIGYSNAANNRALELFDLTLQGKRTYSELKEIARARELWLDYFVGNNQYKQTAKQWEKYFMQFNYALSLQRTKL